ncbi:MAG TPA: hypothetical protein VGG89_17040 [Candidatus Baltobacteraceae bacterium]|jgi:hypothetical protein
MMAPFRDHAEAEALMRAQILAFLEEYCRGMTLRDAREWFVDAARPDVACAES